MNVRRLLAVAVLATAVSASAAVDPSLFGALRWRLIGPFRGGRVLAVTGVPGQPEHFYFGSVNGGVWETTDAGRTWKPIFDDQPIGSIGAIAVAPSNPQVIYVGSGEADMRSDIAQGDGMYRSSDGGKTWTHIGLGDSQQIGRVIVHPADPDLVYVAALGHPYGPNAERGLFRSQDGGKTWNKVLGKDNDTGAIDVAFEPGNPRVLYAALWQTRRTPWSVYPPSNGPGTGLFKSTDAGTTWTQLRGGGFPETPGRIGIDVAPSRPSRIYAIVDSEREGGMYRSDDSGRTWARTSSDSRIWERGWYFGGVTVEPKNADVVYSVNINLYQSTDAGVTWAPVKGAPGGDDYHQLWIDPRHPERRILGVDQGTVVSVNGGATWSSWDNQPTAQLYHVITDDRFPYRVYGAQQDSGGAAVPSRTGTYQGISMMDFREITAGGEADNIAPDPRDPDVIYGGRVQKLDTRTGQTRLIDPSLPGGERSRRTWTLPLVFSRRDPRVLYFANQRIYRTDDGGERWTVISPDLTREDPGIPANLDAPTAALRPAAGTRYGVVYAIAPSRVADHDIWAGTDDGQIWRTRDEGAHWNNVTPPQLTPWSKVGIIETSHFDPETAYAAIDRHRLDDFRAYIYRTHDGGKSWQPAASGIPDGSFVNAVREDSVRRGLLYAGTEKGVWVSFDDGDHWQPLQLNLPVTSVRDIDVHENDLVIATHGRSFWVLDDVSPLRTADAVPAQMPWLYPPAAAVRFRPAGFTGTPLPKEEPAALNPAAGAYIDYVLPAAAREVRLAIYDAAGALVRSYSSLDRIPVANPADPKLRTAPEWFTPPVGLSAAPGMHRFVWPLRYPVPKALQSSTLGVWTDGIWAPPASYRVVLSVDGRAASQPLVVTLDPRVNVTPEQAAAQFALARDIEAARAPLAAAAANADSVVKALVQRISAGGKNAPALQQTLRRAVELSDVVASTNPSNYWWVIPARTTTLKFVSDAMSKLAVEVDGADAAPSPDALAAWAMLKPRAADAVRAWDAFTAGELADLNRRLVASGEAAIP